MEWKKHLVKDDTPIWYGKHKGTKFKDLPIEYLQWLSEYGFRGSKKYAKEKLEEIESESHNIKLETFYK